MQNIQEQKQKAFTLIELLVVIAIIGLLASIVLMALNTARGKARDAKRKADIRQIMLALEMYYDDNGEYPASGGASSPNSGWSNSSDSSWDTLQSKLNNYITLPKDPKNETGGWAGNGKYNYDYYSLNYGCQQQWYMLVYKLENPDIDSPGVTACDGTNFNYSGTITIGVSGSQ
jgi:type II secretion system protein G